MNDQLEYKKMCKFNLNRRLFEIGKNKMFTIVTKNPVSLKANAVSVNLVFSDLVKEFKLIL